jgi:hypothetical protein
MRSQVSDQLAGIDWQVYRDVDLPGLAIRRTQDRCFFAVEEVVYTGNDQLEGFIVEGHLIGIEEIADIRVETAGVPRETCDRLTP